MTLNWHYLFHQLLMVVLSAGLAGALLGLLRLARIGRGTARLWVELPVFAAVLFALGNFCRELGYAHLLPHARFPWTVGAGLAFYWMAMWWPLRVLLLRAQLRRTRAGKLTLLAAAIVVLTALWSLFVEPQRLECERVELRLPDAGPSPIRVAHLSDTQVTDLGARERAMIRAVNEFEPHLIIFTGDYIAGPIGEQLGIIAMREIIAQLHPSHGIYATTSDSDNERQRREIFAGLPVTYLLNKSTTVDVDGVRVRIGGLSHYAPRWSRMAGDARDDELFIVACHSPDFAEATSERLPLADLYLCGHTHGGQIQIPFLGPPLTMCEVTPRHVAAGGVFETAAGMPFLVTRGVGMEGDYAPRFRFNCRPHLFLLTVTAATDGSAGANR